MAPEALATIFSVAIAVLALLPPERRLDLQIRLNRLDYLVILSGVSLVHYILFFPILDELGLTLDLGSWRWGFTPESASYLALGATGGYATVRAWRGKLSRHQIGRFQQLIEHLLHSRQYAKLTYLMRQHLPQLMRIRANRYWLPRLRRWLDPSSYIPIANPSGTESVGRIRGIAREWARRAARLIPSYSTSEEVANTTLHRVLHSDHFVRDLARSDPYLGIEILAYETRQRDEFQTKWLTALLDDYESVLYYEIESNQNLQIGGGYHRYIYYPENRIIYFYCHNAHVAEKLALYKPIGDYLTGELDRRYRSSEDRFNQPLDDYFEEARWRCPTHAVLRLFEFMVSEALYQDIKWHMWLYYFPGFVRQMDRNLNPSTHVDLLREWPTPYHYHIYEMITMLTDWVRGAADLLGKQTNVELQSADLTHENDNIPKSAIIALAKVSGIILTSDSVGDHYRAYILEILLRRIENLRKLDGMEDYADLMLEAVARGDSGWGGIHQAADLAALRVQIDPLLWYSTGEELIEQIKALTER